MFVFRFLVDKEEGEKVDVDGKVVEEGYGVELCGDE